MLQTGECPFGQASHSQCTQYGQDSADPTWTRFGLACLPRRHAIPDCFNAQRRRWV